MVEYQLPKLNARVRFPSPAPSPQKRKKKTRSTKIKFCVFMLNLVPLWLQGRKEDEDSKEIDKGYPRLS